MGSIEFTPPSLVMRGDAHRAEAAARNASATAAATDALLAALSGLTDTERVLIKAAAGAGKSYALKAMVAEALNHERCGRVAVAAFANKQVYPLAAGLGELLGAKRVCLFAAKDRFDEIPEWMHDVVTVESDYKAMPASIEVVVATSHKLESGLQWLPKVLEPAICEDHLFDVLFVDEAWQLPLHRYRRIWKAAPITVGVGDVGQLPPLDPGENPWRGDRGYNPYRAWPTSYEGDEQTWSVELPAVWRPTAAQLGLWRAFYPEWGRLDCVAAPEDRTVELGALSGVAADVWAQVASGVPTLVEVDGLAEPDAADIDPPLLGVVEGWLDELIYASFTVVESRYDDRGEPATVERSDLTSATGDPLIAVLATRNQAVDDAHDMVARLVERHQLPDGVIIASTVDSWQGQTNAITVAIHPLSGASALDEFNSAFGRLAVTCTRATHGLLLVTRSGLKELLDVAPPRPGTPLGEPGNRQLPRQTHRRILETFTQGKVSVDGIGRTEGQQSPPT